MKLYTLEDAARARGTTVDKLDLARVTPYEFRRIAESTTEPTQHCTTCGTGPFFHVEAREFPTLCSDHADEASRGRHGWTPENSRD